MGPSTRKRLLVVTPTFYPNPTVSSVRVTEFCRHLPEFGWDPVVVTNSYGHRASFEGTEIVYLDRPSSVAVGGGKTVLKRFPSLETVAVPDPSILFWRRQRATILATARERAVDAVLTTSPPHSVHAVGKFLKQAGVPWIADFRDPYLGDDRYRPEAWAGFGSVRTGSSSVRSTRPRIWSCMPFRRRRARPAGAIRKALLGRSSSRTDSPPAFSPRSHAVATPWSSLAVPAPRNCVSSLAEFVSSTLKTAAP